MRSRRIAGGAAVLAVVATVITGICVSANGRATASDAPAQPVRRISVTVTPLRTLDFEDALVVQGNVTAQRLALVSPRVAGVLDTIFVDEGDTVVAGQTRLFQTDPVKLGKTVEVRRHEVEVAECALREKQSALDKNQADFDKAEYDWNRYRELFERGVSSEEELEEAQAEYRRCAAMLKNAKALVELADAQRSQAHSALSIAEKDLADALVVAPIDGQIAQRFQEPGEMGTPGNPVLRIEDRSLVEVSVFIPADAYGRVAVDQTPMHVTVNSVDLGQQVVSYKGPTIDPTSRTFEARCLLHDPPPAVAPGAMAHVRVILDRRSGLGVPRDALQRRAGGRVIFLADGDTARMVPVEVGLEQDGICQVTAADLHAGQSVIVTGGYFLNPGDAIQVATEGR